METKFEFRKERDPGQVMTVTFQFIRVYYKPILLSILYFAMPFLLIGLIILGSAYMDMILNFNPSTGKMGTGVENSVVSMGLILLGLLILFIGTIFLVSSVNEIIKYAVQNPGKIPAIGEVWKMTRKKFLVTLANFLVWNFVSGIFFTAAYVVLILLVVVAAALMTASPFFGILAFIIAFILFMFMMVYFYACTYPMFFIATFEDKNVIDAFGRSISLFHAKKKNFWGGIWVSVLGTVVVYLAYNMISTPLLVVLGIIDYNDGKFDFFDPDSNFRGILAVVYGVVLVVMPFSTIVPFIASAFKYFDMAERADGAGLRVRIAKIGDNTDFDALSYEQSY